MNKIKEKANEYEENWNYSRVSLAQAFEDGADHALQELKEEVAKTLTKSKQLETKFPNSHSFKGCVRTAEKVLKYIKDLEDHGQIHRNTVEENSKESYKAGSS